MPSELKTAFSHPEARAKALSGDAARDRISLRDHIVDADIGAFEDERGVTQRLSFNLVVELFEAGRDAHDDVDQILSYDVLIDAVETALSETRLALLETLAERVAALVLAQPRAARVFVRIEKLDRGNGALGVEIMRDAERAGAQATPAGPQTAPTHAQATLQIVYLGAPAQDITPDENTPVTAQQALLDAAARHDGPVVIVTAPHDMDRPETADQTAQEVIALLAMDQAAWALAGLAPELTVRSNRTELDWAIDKGLVSVWAPSKMIRDAVPAVSGGAQNMADWLCDQLGVAQITVIGAADARFNTPARHEDAGALSRGEATL